MMCHIVHTVCVCIRLATSRWFVYCGIWLVTTVAHTPHTHPRRCSFGIAYTHTHTTNKINIVQQTRPCPHALGRVVTSDGNTREILWQPVAMSTDSNNASAGQVCRVQLVDDDVLQDAGDREDAHVDAFVVPDRSVHAGVKATLVVQCPLHIRLLRKAYVKALGYALHLVDQQLVANCSGVANPANSVNAANAFNAADADAEEATATQPTHMPRRMPDALSEFDVVMSPRPQLNCVIALGCLGYFVDTADTRATATRLIVRSEWPNAPAHACTFAEQDPRDHRRRSAKAVVPSARLFQMQTLWSGSDQVFRTSYYDLVCAKFDWVDREGLFESTVASARHDGTLRLRPLDLAMLRKTDAATPLYAEYARHDGCVVSFFGTAGDVLAKAGLLWQNSTSSDSSSASSSSAAAAADSHGLASLLKAHVYYVKTSMRRAVLAVLNKQGRRAKRTRHFRNTAENQNQANTQSFELAPLPHLELDHIRWLPQQALRNLGKIWFPSTSQELRQRAKNEPSFCDAVLDSLPAKVLDAMKSYCADLDGVAQCLLALAVCPDIMEDADEE